MVDAPATKSQLKQLDGLLTEIHIATTAGEFFSPAITKDAKTFKALLAIERKMERTVKAYLKDLAENRAAGYVDWGHYQNELAKQKTAADIKIDVNIDLIKVNESKTLIKVLLQLLFDGTAVGVDAAQRLYKIPAEYQTIIDAATKQARLYGASLVKDISSTTAGFIQESVANSLALGLTRAEAEAEIIKKIDNPVRAEMIAQTESVNAYGGGIQNFGAATNAKGKVLGVILDERTSNICEYLNDKYGDESKSIPLDEEFELEDGSKQAAPGFHVRCRTGMWLLY